MKATYEWTDGDTPRAVEFVRVEGTNGQPFRFGEGQDLRDIEVQEFYIATTPVTQSFWAHVRGEAPPPVSGGGRSCRSRTSPGTTWCVRAASSSGCGPAMPGVPF